MSRGLAAVALLAVGLFLLLTFTAALTPVAAWEVELLVAVQLPAGPPGDALQGINTLGDLWVWVVLLIGLTVIAISYGRLLEARLVALTFAADLLAAGVKLVVGRDRPEGALVEHYLGQESFAYPSGHVVRATALVAVLAWVLAPSAWRLPLALGGALFAGLLMGYARLAIGVHWPSDVLGGLLLGVAWFAVTVGLLRSTTKLGPVR